MTEILKPKALWELGIPLQKALEYFATDEERQALNNLENPTPIFSTNSTASFLESAAQITPTLQQALDAPRRTSEIHASIGERALDSLFKEEYYGFGYPVEPSPARTPRRIDSAFWDGCLVDWSSGIAWLGNEQYNRIKIIDPKEYPQFDLSAKRPGPISHADKIKWAIERSSRGVEIQRRLDIFPATCLYPLPTKGEGK